MYDCTLYSVTHPPVPSHIPPTPTHLTITRDLQLQQHRGHRKKIELLEALPSRYTSIQFYTTAVHKISIIRVCIRLLEWRDHSEHVMYLQRNREMACNIMAYMDLM